MIHVSTRDWNRNARPCLLGKGDRMEPARRLRKFITCELDLEIIPFFNFSLLTRTASNRRRVFVCPGRPSDKI